MTPHNLPPRLEPFVNRESELSQITQALLDPYIPIVTIVGIAGIGKTALALEVAHRLLEKGDFPGGILWLDSLRANTLPALLETMEAVLATPPGDLVREGVHPTSLALREGIPAYLRTQPCLLIFDGLDAVPDDKDVVAFLDRLPSPSKSLVTSRKKVGLLGQERVFELRPLNEEETAQLLTAAARRYGVKLAPKDAREIGGIAGGLPLVIMLAVAASALLPISSSFLAAVRGLVKVLKGRLEQGEVTLQAAFRVVYDRLPDTAKCLLRRLAVFEGDVNEEAIGQVCQVEEWREALTELEQLALVVAQNRRYRLHPEIRQLALEQLEAADERSITEERAANYFLSLAQAAQNDLYSERAPNVIAMVNAERANLLTGISWYQKRKEWDKVMTYGLALGELFRASGDWTDRLKVLEWAMDAAIKAGDERLRAVIVHNLGVAHQELGNYTLARSSYEGSLAIKKSLGDKKGLSVTLHQLGLLAQAQGDYELAQRYYKESLEIGEELGDRLGEAQTLSNLGAIHQAQGRWAEAVELYQRALSVFEELGDRHGEGQVFANLANVYQARGELDRAAELYEQALFVFRELGDQLGEGQVFVNLASVYQVRGELDRAAELYEQALSVFRELGDRHGEGQVFANLASVYQARGELDRATDLYERALAIYERLGDRPGVTQLSINLGKLAQTKSNYNAARRYYERGLKIAEELDDKFGIATATSQLGELAEAEGNYVTAVRSYMQTLALLKELKSTYQRTVVKRLTQLHDKLGESAFQLIAQEAGVEIPAEILMRRPLEPTDPRFYWINSGRRYQREQNWLAAIEAYQKARALFDPAEMSEEERQQQYVEIGFRLGICLRQAERWSEALALQQENFAAFRQLGDLKGQADTYMEVGHLHQLLNNYEEAWLHYLDAYRLYRRANRGQGDELGMAAASEALGTLEFYARMFLQAMQDLEDARSLYLSLGLSGKATLVEEILKAARKALEEREAIPGT